MNATQIAKIASPAEFHLAMHVRRATWAVKYSRVGLHGQARDWARHARSSLASYMECIES